LEIVGDLAVAKISGSGSWNTSGSITGTSFWSNTYLHADSYIRSNSDIYTQGSGDDFWLGNYTQGSASFRAYANGDLYAGGSATTTNLDVTTRLGFASATGASLFVTSGGFGSLYTTGLSAFGDTTFTHATGTSITGTLGHFDSICLSGDCQSAWPAGSTTSTWYGNIELANATSSYLYFGTATGSSLFANTAVFGALTVGGQSVCLANGTNCPTSFASLTITGTLAMTTGNITIGGGTASSTLEIMGGSLWTLANYDIDETNVPTSTSFYLSSKGTMIPGMLFGATNTQYAWTDQIHLGDGCATTSMPVTFYWTSATGSGNVVWGVRAKAIAEGEYQDAVWGSWVYATGTYAGAYDRMSTTTLSNLVPASWDSCRDTLYLQFSRNQESGDTFGSDVLLEKVVLEYGKKSLTD
jgi:hypothetical protein